MKKFLILLAAALIQTAILQPLSVVAQGDTPVKPVVIPELEKFYGTWRYQKGNEIFEITLKEERHISKRYNLPYLVGSHYYRVGSAVVDGYYDKSKNTILVGKIKTRPARDENVVTFRFGTNLANPIAEETLTYIPGSTPTLQWALGPVIPPPIILKDQPVVKREHKVPTSLILTKVK